MTFQHISKRASNHPFLMALTLGILLNLMGCSSPPQGIKPVAPFDANRYLGTWYEIARLDHSFERGMTHVTALYRPNPDGSLEVINRGYLPESKTWKEAEGHALFTDSSHVGALKVSFFGPFYGGYFVAALDPDYQWSLVVGPNRDYFWILARTPNLSDVLKTEFTSQAQSLGIDVSRLIWVDQSPPAP